MAKEIFAVIFTDDVDPEKYVEEHGLAAVTDEAALRDAVRQAVEANPQSVADYLAGKKKAMGFLVGQTMRSMGGKADPALVNRLVGEALAQKAAAYSSFCR